MKKLMMIICLIMTVFTVYSSPHGVRVGGLGNVDTDYRIYRKEEMFQPWVHSTEWRNATNQIAVLGRLLFQNRKEYGNLLNVVKMTPDAPRLKVLSKWISNEQKALDEQTALKERIETALRPTPPVQIILVPITNNQK